MAAIGQRTAQAAYMHIDRAIFHEYAITPYPVQYLRA
jgi:hypothetical protein